MYRKNIRCISKESVTCSRVCVIKNVLLLVDYVASLRLYLSDDYAVFFHKGLKIGPLHTHIPGRPGDIPIISLEGMDQKISFHLFYGFYPDFFLESL